MSAIEINGKPVTTHACSLNVIGERGTRLSPVQTPLQGESAEAIEDVSAEGATTTAVRSRR
ncbi:hypothetical protein [Nesterenkonia ebinurensis]|uniref:hypothetical protein n=1 Tax=Nesterenkonia ebinurensis TaxID=2608252 RepID=UPI00123D4B5A|nr:hypothetical protein [Nesterenkonia ebinurensis]